MGTPKTVTRELPPSAKPELIALAERLDREIQSDLKSMDVVTIQTMTRVAERLTRMRDEQLWKYLGFRRFADYVKHVHSKLAKSRSKLFNLLAAHALTTGVNPIDPEIVEKMGQKKAVELSRLAPHQRTPEVVRTAVEQPLSKVRNIVTAKLNEELPPDEQKPMVEMFTAMLPLEVCTDLEALLDVMEYMDGVRDGDTTWTLRQKAIYALIEAGRNYWQDEIVKAREYKAALEGMEASPAAGAQEQQDR